jgi:hypothetical protein
MQWLGRLLSYEEKWGVLDVDERAGEKGGVLEVFEER